MKTLAQIALLVLVAACQKNGGAQDKPRTDAAPKAHRAEKGDVAVVGATVVPMDKENHVLPDHTVLVRGDKIVLVAPAADVDTTGATVVDGKNQWLLPGLADMHVHIQSENDLGLFPLNGVTTVRNLFGFPMHLDLKKRIAAGELDGPTLFTAGPIVDGDPPIWPNSAVARTADEARAIVRAQKAAGYDWIKVYSNLTAEAYAAAVEEAKAVGLPLGGHVPKAVGIDKALAAGQRTIEHLDGYIPWGTDPQITPERIATTVATELWNCPTLIVTENFARMDAPDELKKLDGIEFVSPLTLSQWEPKNDFRLAQRKPEDFVKMREKNLVRLKLVGDLHKAGARLVLGTDTGNPFVIPGFAVHEELTLLVKAGLTPWQALRTATAAAAELAGTPGAFGVVAGGARADLILVDADPLVAVGNVDEPTVVIVRGEVHRREELLKAARERLKAPPEDPFAGQPALVAEGAEIVRGRWDIFLRDQPIGADRAVLAKTARGERVIVGQSAYLHPTLRFDYRSTIDGLKMSGPGLDGGLVAGKDGKKVTASVGGGKALELAVADDAIVAPQTIAEFFWYAERLADLEVGKERTITAAEIMAEEAVKLESASFSFTRQPDEEGRRVYALKGTHGKLEVTGRFTVDADGAPAEVALKLRFGSLVMKRVPEPAQAKPQ